jgi:hypothetical protein
MWRELRTLLWLQWKLTLSIFRRRESAQSWSRILSLVFRVLQLVFTFPLFILMGAGLAVGLALLSPRAAYEAAMLVNVGFGLIWLLIPASYSQQLMERFEMARLFPHPISFRGIVVGSTLLATLSMTGLWTVPMLLGEVIGLAWHAPVTLPMLVLGAIPLFIMLVLAGRIVEDLFDLVAADRRLRGLLLFLFTLPFLLLYAGQYIIQFTTQNFENVGGVATQLFGPGMLGELSRASGPSEFIEALSPSRFLVWLPPAWPTAAMGLPGQGAWGKGALYLFASVAAVAALFAVHAGVTRRLMEGTTVSIGPERVKVHRVGWRPPGPPELWALFRKDWLYLLRSPLPRRMVMVVPMAAAGMIPAMSALSSEEGAILAPTLLGGFIVVVVGIVINMGITSDYFGAVDREGFAALATSPVDRRYVLISENLVVSVLAVTAFLLVMLVVAALTKRWDQFVLGSLLGVLLQISCAPAYNLAAILGPYRVQLQWQGRQRGSIWALAGLAAAPPVLALMLLPQIFWRPGIPIGILAATAYSVGLYWLTLPPLARLLSRREYEIHRAVTSDE